MHVFVFFRCRRFAHWEGFFKMQVTQTLQGNIDGKARIAFILFNPEVSKVGWDASLWHNESASPWMFANEGGVVYGVRLSPSGVKDRIISIQWLSFLFLYSLSFLWISSMTMMDKSLMEWSLRLKGFAIGFSIRP